LLPFGLAIGAFMPAIFALYFARRGPFVDHLKKKPLRIVQNQYRCFPVKRTRFSTPENV
jgi:hypothetical protein